MNGRARWWGAAAMVTIAAVAAVLSYFDGLFVAQLAGNHDWRAWLYPLLPDQLIVICLIALLAAKRRPVWATCGLLLGIGLTLAMNVGAGIAHSTLDAVVDGFVPVVFFVAVEVFIGYVRRGRGERSPVVPALPAQTPSQSVPVTVPLPTVREIRERRNCSQATAAKIRAELKLLTKPPGTGPGGGARKVTVKPGAAPAGDVSPRVPAGATMNGSGAHG